MLRLGRISVQVVASWTALLVAVCCAADREIMPVFEMEGALGPRTKIDRAVFARLRQERIEPANLCSDAVFLRRVHLDLIGTIPTADEAVAFLRDQNPKKRQQLVDALLERPEYADYWAMKWCDILRVKAEFPVNLWPNAVQAYHRWIITSLRENKPYDQFARELLTGCGSNFRDPEVNFYRSTQSKEPKEIARAVALAFMGVRADKWTVEQQEEMAKFFSYIGYKRTAEWKEEIVYFDYQKLLDEGPQQAVFPDGTTVELTADKDPREVFADWLITNQNPWFARNIVNRAWFWMMGRGIVHEPDDIRSDNPPSNPKLLSTLEKEMTLCHFDVKELLREITNSKAYQLSSIPQSDKPEAEALFAFYPIRRLDAEVLVDAICGITGSTEEYSSPIPEPFTWVPESQRSIALADGSITSTFLEMFGRPPRDTGLELERNNKVSAAQRLHMLNSSHIQHKIERSAKLRELVRVSRGNQREAIARIYLTILSRLPAEQEIQMVERYGNSEVGQGQAALTDLTWALFNSVEFLYRH